MYRSTEKWQAHKIKFFDIPRNSIPQQKYALAFKNLENYIRVTLAAFTEVPRDPAMGKGTT